MKKILLKLISELRSLERRKLMLGYELEDCPPNKLDQIKYLKTKLQMVTREISLKLGQIYSELNHHSP
jgi:hypothetical protein